MKGPSVIPPAGRALQAHEYASLVEEMEQVVTHSHLFKSLDDTGREQTLESGYVETFPAGAVILEQGTSGDVMYVIMRGKVRVEAATAGGKVRLAELGRGACVGEVSLLKGGPRTATVTALENVDAVAFARHRIERVLQRYPKVKELLESVVESRAQDTIEKILDSSR